MVQSKGLEKLARVHLGKFLQVSCLERYTWLEVHNSIRLAVQFNYIYNPQTLLQVLFLCGAHSLHCVHFCQAWKLSYHSDFSAGVAFARHSWFAFCTLLCNGKLSFHSDFSAGVAFVRHSRFAFCILFLVGSEATVHRVKC